MAGLKASAKASSKSKKSAAKPGKERSTGKPSTLSEEYVVDSDSDGGLGDSSRSGNSTSSKAENIVTPPDTASKPNGSAKVNSIDQSTRKRSSGTGETIVNGGRAQRVKQPETNPSKEPETPSARAKWGSIKASAKSGTNSTTTSKANLPAGSKAQKVVERPENSDEEDEETDEESSDSTESEREVTTKAGSQPSLKAGPSSSKATAPRAPTTPKAPAFKQKPDSPDSSEGSTSDDSSSDEDDAPTTDNVKRRKQSQTPLKPTVQAYKPPPGFAPATVSHPETSHLPNLFSPTHLASKQVWHITLPAAIPISAIKDISMDKILGGGTALSHDGSDYGFVSVAKSQQNHAHVLLPNPEHNDYRAATKAITRSLHLQQLLKLPSLEKAVNDNAGSTQVQSQTGKVIHVQPSGLRMRYAPFGDESGTLGLGTSSDEDGEPGPAKPTFRMPPSFGVRQQQEERMVDDNADIEKPQTKSPVTSPPRKRRMDEVTDDITPETPSKKRRKKHRRDEDQGADVVEETPVKGKQNGLRDSLAEVNGHDESAAEPASSARVTKRREGETPEEKAKRKAERQQRKEEHKKRKEEKKRKKGESQDSALSGAAEA